MKRLLRIVLVAVAVSCVGSVASASAQTVIPTLTCQTYVANTNTVIAVFGYVSTYSTTVHLDVGVNNFFSPGVLFRNQPTDFLPGAHTNVFATSFVQTGSQTQITWALNGGTDYVSANGTSGPSCSQLGASNTILNGSGPPANSLGADGDFYIDTSAEVLYGPKAGGAWLTTGVPLVGPQGAPGQNGTDGTNGNTILNGVGAPPDALGGDGDFYIDNAAHVLYGPKANGHGPASGIPLAGPTGPTGATGATGPIGPQGPPGKPVCRNTLATILACDLLFARGTWTVGPSAHATAALSRTHTVYARGRGTVSRTGRLALRLRKLRRVKRGDYTLTVRLTRHGVKKTIRRSVTIR
jgi:hypothetical protein